jgi:chromobox protein 1
VVEKILSHVVQEDGTLKFEVKWEGYEKKSDRTWEPEENLVDASAALNEYLESIGGRDNLYVTGGVKGKKRGRPSSGTPSTTTKRSKKNGDVDSDAPLPVRNAPWKPPAGSWEDHIAQLDACEDEESGKLMVYLTWKNGHKTQHETGVIYQRCPQKMLQFYEQHVRIIKRDPDAESIASGKASNF